MILRKLVILACVLSFWLAGVSYALIQLGTLHNQSREIIFVRDSIGLRGHGYNMLDIDRLLEINLSTIFNMPQWSPDGELLLYDDYFRSDIVIQTRQGEIRNLTNNPAGDFDPRWSPDGTMIAFRSDRTDVMELYVMDADGTNIRQVNSAFGNVLFGLWSPDSQKIAYFVANGGIGGFYIMDVDTVETAEPELVATSLVGCTNYQWSPDSRFLMCYMQPADDIFRMDVETDATLNLTNHPASDTNPVWSPDGSLIAFQSDRGRSMDIYVMDADGNNPRNLTNHPQPEGYPQWSPDGTRLLYTGGTSAQPQLYTVDIVSGETIHLTESLYQQSPSATFFSNLGNGSFWSPDGEQVIFRVANGQGRQLYIVNVDGTGLRAITRANPLASDSDPRWRP
ncbi:MAG: hypothetical protein RLP44_22120 [Aggregatilineales bacterium]